MKGSLILAPVLAVVLLGGVTPPTRMPERDAASSPSLGERVESALDHGDLRTAVQATEAAQRRAARQGRWEPWIEVGDAYCRIAVRAEAPEASSERAREAYQAALHSARRAESLDGVLRAAEGFAVLGDADKVEFSLRVARDLAGSDPEAIDDVRAAAGRLTDVLEGARGERGDEEGPGG